MSATIDDTGCALASRYGHANCLMCGTENPWSLGLDFIADGVSGVRTEFKPDERLQGYHGMLHGGVAAALLDTAMTHCLFHHGIRGVTGNLRVCYPHPVPMGQKVAIQACLTEDRPPLCRLKASLEAEGKVLVWAKATFCRVTEEQLKVPD